MKSAFYLFISITQILNCIRPLLSETTFRCVEQYYEYSFLPVKLLQGIICKASEPEEVSLSIAEMPTNTKHISVITKNGAVWKIKDADIFANFRNLSSLCIELYGNWKYSDTLNEPNQQKKLSENFFGKIDLDTLSISYTIKNTNMYPWHLPKTLKNFTLFNSACNYSFSSCSLLKYLNLSKTDLTTMPVLNWKTPNRLKLLDLSDNPLTNFTVEDIARYCILSYLSLNGAKFGYCERVRLKKWIDLVLSEDKTFVFVGDLINETTSSRNCSGYTLDEANRLREQCKATDFKDRVLITVILLGVLVLVIAIVLVGFCIAWIHFRPHWIHHPDDHHEISHDIHHHAIVT